MDASRVIDWTRTLYRFWDLYNVDYLDEAMRRPVIRVDTASATLGTWHRDLRELRISADHIATATWLEVCGTLRHEMAHQFVDEVLLVRDEPPHGPAFRLACERLRVVPSATGGGSQEADRDSTARMVERVHKLFALGTSPNEHEATAAMRKARELVDAHQLSDLETGRDRQFGIRQLGQVKRRHTRWEHLLGAILGEFFHVEPIWSPSFDAASMAGGRALLVHGSERNLVMAEYVHGAVSALLPRLWSTHRARCGIRDNRDRQRYFEGLLAGFRDKLRAADPLSAAARALVVRGDARLRDWFRWHHPRVRSGRIGSSAGHEAFSAGRRDGRNLHLAEPIDGSTAATGAGRLLQG